MGLDVNMVNIGCPANHRLADGVPDFAKHKPDVKRIKEAAENYDFESLVVIGNGGSVTSFRAYYKALERNTDKNVHIVTTMSPDYLSELSEELSPEDTLVMPISKSGETAGVIESLIYFMNRDYPVFAVTSDNEGTLRKIVERKDYDFIEHPDISGRFTGATETALVPACFAGLDVEDIRKGAERMYSKLSPGDEKNVAKISALAMYNSEISGFDEVFTPFYSRRMMGFYPLFVQLMHETLCKKGRGQTVFGDMGPECQHHTVQRLFGGKKNILTFFLKVENHEPKTLKIGSELNDIPIRGKSLEEFNGMELSRSLDSEMNGVKKALEENNLPAMILNIDKITPETCGETLAFMQYLAFYSAKLREINAFNQPNVERSKELGFKSRFEG